MSITKAAPTCGRAVEEGARVVRIPPPLYFGTAFAGSMLLSAAVPALGFGSGPTAVSIGSVLLAAGVGLALAGIVQVRRAKTTIVPRRPVTTLLTKGVYRLSRNPMYTGLAVSYFGGALLVGSWWPLLTWPLTILAVRILVIGPEERYLGARFGPAYRDYRMRTRRWIGFSRQVFGSAGGHNAAAAQPRQK